MAWSAHLAIRTSTKPRISVIGWVFEAVLVHLSLLLQHEEEEAVVEAIYLGALHLAEVDVLEGDKPRVLKRGGGG